MAPFLLMAKLSQLNWRSVGRGAGILFRFPIDEIRTDDPARKTRLERASSIPLCCLASRAVGSMSYFCCTAASALASALAVL
jgi:hypothetical protein